jgi:hypothetical protein
MTIRMENLERLSFTEMEDFLKSHRHVRCAAVEKGHIYEFIEGVLQGRHYEKASRGQKGTLRGFLAKVTGLSRAQVTRLVQRWGQTRQVRRKPVQRPNFPRRYRREDIVLLAQADAAAEDLSAPALRRMLQREHEVFGKAEYERLASISPSHIYNLRKSAVYAKVRVRVQHTQARQVAIGERRKPDPQGKPGYLRVDTVHQGQHDGQAGVYHINAVDTVTQWEVVGCVATICERDLVPVLEAMPHQFPFRIRGFHCDNGSEFINHRVAQMLNKLLAEFTKSRAYRTTDNALVEGKNGAVVRKYIGRGPIGCEHAEAFQKFYTAHLNPYLNYHRPCGFAEVVSDARGRRKRRYPAENYQTPYEKLRLLSNWRRHLKPGVTAAHLEQQAKRRSDLDAARQMQQAKIELLSRCRHKP